MTDDNQDTLIDDKQFNQLLSLDNGAGELYSSLLEMWFDTYTTTIDELKKIAEVGPASTIQSLAHKVKGSCGNIGAKQMASVCAELETKASNGDISSTAKDCETLEQLYEQTRTLLMTKLGKSAA